MIKKHFPSLDNLVYSRLNKLYDIRYPSQVHKFPHVFECICPVYCLKKKDAFSVLRYLEKKGSIDIIRGHGIRIKKFNDHLGGSR